MAHPRPRGHKSPKAPLVVGDYVIGPTVGEGTFGKVKSGTHERTDEKVAIKILEKEKVASKADVDRVIRELQILKFLRHPHIIHLYEIIENPKRLYLIMEYANGGELFTYITNRGRVEEREAVKLFRQIISGVEKIHMMNVVHRDLKPENLLLDAWNNVKIIDFGLSNRFQAHQLLKTACGSPCYAPPEMIQGKEYVPQRCDVWSCGVILFATLCGYLPFDDRETPGLYKKIQEGDYTCASHVSLDAQNLISLMLTPDPARRATINKIRHHRWFQGLQCARNLESRPPDVQFTEYGCGVPSCQPCRFWYRPGCSDELDEDIIAELEAMDFNAVFAKDCLRRNKRNPVTASYYLLLERKTRLAYECDPFSAFDAEVADCNAPYIAQEQAVHHAHSAGDILAEKVRKDRDRIAKAERSAEHDASYQDVMEVPRPFSQRSHRSTSSGGQRVCQTARLPSRHERVHTVVPRLALPEAKVDEPAPGPTVAAEPANPVAHGDSSHAHAHLSHGKQHAFDATPASSQKSAQQHNSPRITYMATPRGTEKPVVQPFAGSTWVPETPRDPTLLTFRGAHGAQPLILPRGTIGAGVGATMAQHTVVKQPEFYVRVPEVQVRTEARTVQSPESAQGFGPSVVERTRPLTPRDLHGAATPGSLVGVRDNTPKRTVVTQQHRTVAEPTGELNTRTVLGPIVTKTVVQPTFPSTFVPLSARGDRSQLLSGRGSTNSAPLNGYSVGSACPSQGTPLQAPGMRGGFSSFSAGRAPPYFTGSNGAMPMITPRVMATSVADANWSSGQLGLDKNRGKSTSTLESGKTPSAPPLRTSQSQRLPDVPVVTTIISGYRTPIGSTTSTTRSSSVSYPGAYAHPTAVYRVPSAGPTIQAGVQPRIFPIGRSMTAQAQPVIHNFVGQATTPVNYQRRVSQTSNSAAK